MNRNNNDTWLIIAIILGLALLFVLFLLPAMRGDDETTIRVDQPAVVQPTSTERVEPTETPEPTEATRSASPTGGDR